MAEGGALGGEGRVSDGMRSSGIYAHSTCFGSLLRRAYIKVVLLNISYF